MQIPYDGLISPTAYRRGFIRHYMPGRGEVIFRLAGMMAVVAGLLATTLLGYSEPVIWVMGVIISLMLALPWVWPSLLSSAAWRNKLRTGIHERGFITSQALVYEKDDPAGGPPVQVTVPLRELLKVRVFGDMLLLYYTPNAFMIFPVELLTNQGQWHQLVQQVLARVRDHDTLPRKKSWALALAYIGLVFLLALLIWQTLQY